MQIYFLNLKKNIDMAHSTQITEITFSELKAD